MNKLNQSDILKLLYKMYNEEDKTVYVGSAAKFECDIKGEHGLLKRDRIYTWYPLYDNGICCFSVLSNDTAIEALNKGFFDTRIGTNYEILEALYKYRNIIYKGNILDIVNYSKVNKELLLDIIDRADKYKQLGIRRREATANFIMKQIETIDLLNYRRL